MPHVKPHLPSHTLCLHVAYVGLDFSVSRPGTYTVTVTVPGDVRTLPMILDQPQP